MKKVGIMANPRRDIDLEYTKNVIGFLQNKVKIYIEDEIIPFLAPNHGFELLTAQNAEELDFVVILGGDGTILDSLALLNYSSVPLLGINLGRLGFLAAAERYEWQYYLDLALKGAYQLESRSLLAMEHMGNKRIALNDVVLFRASEEGGVISLDVYIDNVLLAEYYADGIIISTPTGSTAYSLAAGGPIISPKAEAILLNPINPHSLSNRAIVIGPDEKIKVILKKGSADVRSDGDFYTKATDSVFSFSLHETKARFVVFETHNFYHNVYKKIR